MPLIRGPQDPLERCGQGVGCGKWIYEKGLCDECTTLIIKCLDGFFSSKYGTSLSELMAIAADKQKAERVGTEAAPK